jgi:molecular chaperone DnaK (HSP70)
VFDFGGGTLDMTVVEVGGNTPPRTIATHGVLLGGDDLTAALMKKLFHYFGENSKLSDGLPVPAYFFELLYNWQDMVELSRPKYTGIFKQAKEGSDPIGARRLNWKKPRSRFHPACSQRFISLKMTWHSVRRSCELILSIASAMS